jgi:tRNA threonylcarbamoyl adenosine modification protein YeaZ
MTYLMLGIDTATPVTTVGLTRVDIDDGTVVVVDERNHRDPRRHGEILPQLVDDVLRSSRVRPSEVKTVAVGVGPGAYSGLRVGIAAAEALGLALEIPVVGVVTLDALAFATGIDEPFAIVTDARRREVFVAHYRDHRTAKGPPTVGSPELVASTVGGGRVLAPGETPLLPGVDFEQCPDPSAASVCAVAADRLRSGSPTTPVAPLYLRRPDVSASSGPKSVL